MRERDFPFSSEISRGQFDVERMDVKLISDMLSEPALIEMSAFVNDASVSPLVKLISRSVVCVAEIVSMNCPSLTVTVSVEMMTEALSLLIVIPSPVRVMNDDDEAPWMVNDFVRETVILSVLYVPVCSSMVSVIVASI